MLEREFRERIGSCLSIMGGINLCLFSFFFLFCFGVKVAVKMKKGREGIYEER